MLKSDICALYGLVMHHMFLSNACDVEVSMAALRGTVQQREQARTMHQKAFLEQNQICEGLKKFPMEHTGKTLPCQHASLSIKPCLVWTG